MLTGRVHAILNRPCSFFGEDLGDFTAWNLKFVRYHHYYSVPQKEHHYTSFEPYWV